MKRARILLSCIVTIGFSLLLVACFPDTTTGPHEEIAGDWVITIEPTCTTNGEKKKYCIICGKEMLTAYIPMLGHDYQDIIEIPKTCTEDGLIRVECSQCGDHYYIDDYATGHQSSSWQITKTASNDELGTKIRRCEICGELLQTEPYVDNGFNRYGKLSVNGPDLVDKNGQKVQLFGLSTHGFNFFPRFINYNTFANAQVEFGINTIRLAMYTSETGGYCQDNGIYQANLKQMMKNALTDLTSLDMYAIVDWHMVGADEKADKNPLTWIAEASEFFDDISKTFKDNDNILYEICNEPNGDTTWADIAQYANTIIPIIRKNDPDAIVIVGTPKWSADLYSVMASPLKFDNIMYTFHFYASSHKESHRIMVESAYQANIPVFVSEHALMGSDGYGALDLTSGMAWYNLLDRLNISYVAWNISTGPSESSIFKSNATKVDDFADEYLKEWGIWLKDFYRQKAHLPSK